MSLHKTPYRRFHFLIGSCCLALLHFSCSRIPPEHDSWKKIIADSEISSALQSLPAGREYETENNQLYSASVNDSPYKVAKRFDLCSRQPDSASCNTAKSLIDAWAIKDLAVSADKQIIIMELYDNPTTSAMEGLIYYSGNAQLPEMDLKALCKADFSNTTIFAGQVKIIDNHWARFTSFPGLPGFSEFISYHNSLAN